MLDRRLPLVVLGLFMLWQSFPLHGAEKNLFLNADFSKAGQEIPAYWYTEVYPDNAARFIVEEDHALPEGKFISIINHQPADARFVQNVRVEKNRVYRISCLVKTGDLEMDRGGANISVLNGSYSSPEIFDTSGGWRELEVYIRTPRGGLDTLFIAFRLGGYGAMNKGEASFAGVVVEKVDSPPLGVTVANLLAGEESTEEQYTAAAEERTGAGASREGYKPLIYLVLGALLIGLLIFFELRIFTPKTKTDENEQREERL